MASQTYYQIGGFQPHIQWFATTYDDKKLAEAIVGMHSPLRDGQEAGTPVELVLGIKRIGTLHLLLTSDQAAHCARRLNLPYPRGNPFYTAGFESLSPIYFHNAEELARKLSTLKPKAGKGRMPSDTSQANKGYTQGEDGVYRGGFEHCRLFSRIVQNSIPDITKFGLEDTAWSRSIRVMAIVYNTRSLDERPARERLERPFVLDIGYAEAALPDISLKRESATHLEIFENRFIGGSGIKLSFTLGTTETLHNDGVSARICELFKDHQKPVADAPTILLVHHEQKTLNVLRNMGVDVSAWGSGIKDLLRPSMSPSAQHNGYNARRSNNNPRARPLDPRATSASSIPYDEYEQRRNRPRERSRSPQRGGSSSSYAYSSSNRPHSPIQGKTYKPVYVVDIQQLYIKLMQTDFNAESTATIARHLGVMDVKGWCAGNEAALIIDTWRSMVIGPPIDEQRAQRAPSSSLPADVPNPSVPLADVDYEDDSDEDRDPNEIMQTGNRGSALSAGPGAKGAGGANPYDVLDESDYGDSDDSG